MSLVLQSSGGGQITIQEPATASNFTATMPAATGTVMVSGNMPAFSAYQSSAQTISDSVATKINFQTEEFDTNSNYDTTNSRFTPTVAGYYQVNALVFCTQTAQIDTTTWVYKNGSAWKRGFGISPTTGTTMAKQQMPVNCLVYLNGSTDYIEIYAYSDGTGSALIDASSSTTYFQACLVRGA
jgi:hypothetical protein